MAQRLATNAEILATLGTTPSGVPPTDEQIATWSAIAAEVVAPQRFRQRTSRAHALLTAHLLAVAPGLGLGPGGDDLGDVLGPLASEADGPASRSFGAVVSGEAAQWDDAMLARTPYGQAFLLLRRAVRGMTSVCVANGVNRIPH